MSKQELADRLIVEIRVCRKCRLWRDAKNPVPGEGNLGASLILVGEAPGYYKDAMGQPFVSATGKLLDELISCIKLKRSDVFICKIVKHRPSKNREPKEDEADACSPYLDRQIQMIKPEIMVTLGRHSTMYMLSKANIEFKAIKVIRGKVYSINPFSYPVKVLPTFNPAAALYNPAHRSTLEKDFQKIKTELNAEHSCL